MASRKVAVYVKCPYYRKEDGVKLCCEGIVEGTHINQIFPTKQARANFERRHCKSAWEKCPVAMLVSQRLEGKEGI